MLFNVDVDSGAAVSGWLVLDNPGEVPEFKVIVPDAQEVNFRANVFRRDLYDLGLHATGMAGFQLDESLIPDLASLPTFALIESETGLQVYRRFDPERHIEKKVALIETGAMPQIKLVRRAMMHFSMQYPMLDRYSLETVASALSHHYAKSVMATGRINWARFGGSMQSQDYFTTALLGEPYEDLAERILFLRMIAKRSDSHFVRSQLSRFEAVMPALLSMDVLDEKSVLTSFRGLTREQRRVLRSPMTATFGASPEEEIQRRNVSIALDNLAQLDVIGTKSRFLEFTGMVGDALGESIFENCELESLPESAAFADLLSRIGLVGDLLDEDIALYSFACEAITAAIGQFGADGALGLTN